MVTVMTKLPNLLTGLRLALALFTFFGLATAALLSDTLTPANQFALERWAFVAFVVAAITDFFDGWLARKLDAMTVWGAILDPIADKVLVCGAILGLLSLGPNAAWQVRQRLRQGLGLSAAHYRLRQSSLGPPPKQEIWLRSFELFVLRRKSDSILAGIWTSIWRSMNLRN